MKTIFKAGDRVRYGDFEGVPTASHHNLYPLMLRGEGWEELFTKEGKLYNNHDYPIMLTLIESAKVKTVRRFYVWAIKGEEVIALHSLEMLDENLTDVKGRTHAQSIDCTYHKTNTYVDIEVEW